MIYYISFLLVFVAIFILYWERRNKKIQMFLKTAKRDFTLSKRAVYATLRVALCERRQETVPKLFTNYARKHPNKVAFYFENETWTYRQVENFSNKVANFFKRKGYERGDVVALFLENSPEYVCFWLGLSKIGVVTALINTNIVGGPLVHSIETANPRCLVYGSSLKDGTLQKFKKTTTITKISEKISNLQLYHFHQSNSSDFPEDSQNINTSLKEESEESPCEDLKRGKTGDRLMYIYTSGTTGLPKAAILTNRKFLLFSLALHEMTQLKEEDTLYVSLPLYHTAGGVGGVGQSVLCGTTVALRKKFSASNFWKDCVKYKCTAAFYIGEVCRYLLAEHEKKDRIHHSVRKFIGNGLKPQIWEKFVEKFEIQHVYEIYGSTEGNANLINLDNKPGAVGYFPRWLRFIHSMSLVKCDMSTAVPIRGPDGYFQLCKPGEPGLFIGKVSFKKPMGRFDGYINKQATDDKLFRNAFVSGDVYFNSGDILVQDEEGYLYFKDRIGDTFRWKGENVSTSEVEAVISNVLNLNDAVVYGVEVPGCEGRAGMAAVVAAQDLDMENLCQNLKKNLPPYAVPMFVRVMKSVPLTGTFKLMKVDLQKESFDVEKIRDKLYVYDAKNVTYVELTKNVYDDIMMGNVRL